MSWLLVVCFTLILVSVDSYTLQIPNITIVISGYGYPVETHQVQTQDGYILTLYHIPHGRTKKKASNGPVLLQHGLTDSAAGWCLNSPSESLAYILADSGYDVWLGNNRGNGVSMGNVNYGPSNPQFWSFSWDEMGLYDLPANINYILKQTGESRLSYIGHSEGTIQAFAGLSYNPSLAEKLNVFIALAPVAYVGNINIEIMQILAKLDMEEILVLLGVHEFYLPNAIHKILPEVCEFFPQYCNFGSVYFYGPDTYVNATRLDYYTDYEPFPTSVQNIAHWAQGVATNTFQMFDYGYVGNMQHYKQSTPPKYDLSKIPSSLPTYLFTGGIDALADPADVQQLLKSLSFSPLIYDRPDYGHLDPLLGDKAYQYTYPNVLSILGQFAPK